MSGALELSKTSIMVAAGRAVGAREPDPTVRNPDFLAERLLGPEIRALRIDHPAIQALDRDYHEAMKEPEVFGTVRMMMVRTRFIDERLTEALRRGASQVVILGAGFDTRAYRLPELLANAHVFEVDRPATQAIKRRRVEEENVVVPPNLQYVSVDFQQDNLWDKLERAGYHATRKTVFIWEGVTMYLSEQAVIETLRFVASHPPGSSVIFDFVGQRVIRFFANVSFDALPEAARPGVQRIMQLEAGEPWLFGFPDNAEREFLANLGLELNEILPVGSEESVKLYLTRKDGTIVGGLPGAPQAAYRLAEASVRE